MKTTKIKAFCIILGYLLKCELKLYKTNSAFKLLEKGHTSKNLLTVAIRTFHYTKQTKKTKR